MKIKDLGFKEIYSAEPSTPIREIASKMKRHGVGVIPICEGNKVIGVITDRDIVVSCAASGMSLSDCQAREFMTASPVCISPDTDLEEAARTMGREQVHRLCITEGDSLVGMLSLGDLASSLKNDTLLAETVRKIYSPTKVTVSA